MRNDLVLVSTVLVALVVHHGAWADTTEPVHLLYRAPAAGCPTKGEFIARVRARTTRVRPAWEDEKARTFDVAIDGGASFSGRLTLRDAEGHDSVRSVDGETCSKVADALALVVALAVDPEASEPAAATATAPPPLPPEAPRPSPAPPADAAPIEPQPMPMPSIEHAQPREVPSGSWSWRAGAEVVVAGAVAPSLLPGVAPFIEVIPWRRAPLAPSLRLAFERTTSASVAVDGASASFTWTVARVDTCLPLWSWRTLAVQPCARIEAGELDGRASGFPSAHADSAPWFAAGAIGRGRWTVLAPLFVELNAGVMFPLIRDRSYFEPQSVIYEVPAAGFVGGAGLGATLL